jgi:hypothetical protein
MIPAHLAEGLSTALARWDGCGPTEDDMLDATHIQVVHPKRPTRPKRVSQMDLCLLWTHWPLDEPPKNLDRLGCSVSDKHRPAKITKR